MSDRPTFIVPRRLLPKLQRIHRDLTSSDEDRRRRAEKTARFAEIYGGTPAELKRKARNQ